MRAASLQGLALAAACFLVMCLGQVHLVVALVLAAMVWLMYVANRTA